MKGLVLSGSDVELLKKTVTGGKGANGSASARPVPSFAQGGGVSTLPTGGDLNLSGGSGGRAILLSATMAAGGDGAPSPFGAREFGGDFAQTGTPVANGQNAAGFGAGGGGGATIGSTGQDASGGDGSQGLIIVAEFE